MRQFHIPTRISYSDQALEHLRELDGKRVFLVTDEFLSTSDFLHSIQQKILGAQIYCFSKVLPDPTDEIISEAVKQYLQHQPDVILAIGGGSVIDTAKGVHYIVQQLNQKSELGLWVVPTTSGSGSEVTSFAVITQKSDQKKLVLADLAMLPDHAIIAPEAVRTLPAKARADTGMDALSHAFEACLSTNSSDCSDALAEKAIELIFSYLPRSVADSSDLVAIEHLHNASCLAGMAFENAGLGIVHSLSHALGAKFKISHGRCNALLMPIVFKFNAGLLPKGLSQRAYYPNKALPILARIGARYINSANIELQAKQAIKQIENLKKLIGMPKNIRDLKLDRNQYLKAIPEMAERALVDSCTATNPRPVTVDELIALYQELI